MLRSFGQVGLALLTCLLVACAPAAPPTRPTASTRPAEPPAAGPSTAAAPASVVGPSSGSASGEITVFAAASLADAFKEIGEQFQAAHRDARLSFNFGASSQLRTQLEQGARADLFASANQAEMDRARTAGLIGGADRVLVRNRLAVILPKENPGKVAELPDLARPGLRFVTAAPEVPIGVYTQDMLDRMSRDPAFGAEFKERVNANVVSREPNVRQVVAKINLGEADAAVVYSSDVTPDVAANVSRLEVPDRFNTLATYPIALVRNGPNSPGGEVFMAHVLGSDGQAVLKRRGFITGG